MRQRVFIENFFPMDVPGETNGYKLGKVRVFDADTLKEVNLQHEIGFSGRVKGTERVFQYGTVYVIAHPTRITRVVQNFLENRGYVVVSPPKQRVLATR